MLTSISNKFYGFIKTLSKKEITQFKKMLRSPFFVHRQDVGKVFYVLAVFLFKGKELPSKETLFHKAFPEKEYNDLFLRGTLSDLGELLEEYLLIQHIRSDKLASQLKLASIHRRRQLEKNYRKTIRKAATLLEQYPYRNPAYFQELHQFQIEKMHYQTQSKRTEELNLQEIGNSMDILYLMRKLKHACAQIGHQQVFKKGYD